MLCMMVCLQSEQAGAEDMEKQYTELVQNRVQLWSGEEAK